MIPPPAEPSFPPKVTLQPSPTDETANWKTYINTKYGFEFRYPSDHTVYVDVDQKKPALIPASSTSDIMNIVVKEKMVFCCEPSTLSFSIKLTNKKARTWVEDYF